MDQHFVITIGREYGSGGREIGRLVAEKLNVKCYDKELLTLAAKESGICPEVLENHDEAERHKQHRQLVLHRELHGDIPSVVLQKEKPKPYRRKIGHKNYAHVQQPVYPVEISLVLLDHADYLHLKYFC